MKSNVVISFDHVSKKFRKGRKMYLKQALFDIFRPQKEEDFWALKDVNFQIKKGEVVGIIGANGSGKSTILKMIAGVLTPTKGSVEVKGRVGPLIELGAGFHPELTGRENIYLNGVVLGLSKKQVDQKFDSIVAFSGIEEFIDTPVKHYSSGMYVRLGFSIAVHIDPEILLVDEILAVGDLVFQRKCYEKITELKKQGTTIIFVSHSIGLVKEICNHLYLFDKGRIISQGDPNKITAKYFEQSFYHEGSELIKQRENSKRWGDGKAKIVDTWIENREAKKVGRIKDGQIVISLKVKFLVDVEDPIFGVVIRSDTALPIYATNTKWVGTKTGKFKAQSENIIKFKINNFFDTGKYSISPAIAYRDGIRFYDWRDNYLWLWVEKPYKTGSILNYKASCEILP